MQSLGVNACIRIPPRVLHFSAIQSGYCYALIFVENVVGSVVELRIRLLWLGPEIRRSLISHILHESKACLQENLVSDILSQLVW